MMPLFWIHALLSQSTIGSDIVDKLEGILNRIGGGTNLGLAIRIGGALAGAYIFYRILKRLLSSGPRRVYAPGGIMDAKAARRLARQAEKVRNFASAAEIYHSIGDLEKAAELYQESRQYTKAADILIDMGRLDRAIQVLEKSGNLEKLALLFAKKGDYERAAELFIRMNRHTIAAEMYEKTGNMLRAAECYEKGNFYLQAGEIYREFKKFDKAGEMFENAYRDELVSATTEEYQERQSNPARSIAYKSGESYYRAGRHDKSIEVLISAGFYQKAAEIAMEAKKFEEAADLFLRSNLPLKAAEAYEAMGDTKRASHLRAEAYKSEGDELQAAKAYEDGSNFVEAAEIYRSRGDFKKSGQMYMLGEDYLQAAEMFMKAKEPKSAAIAYERAKDFIKAAEIYRNIGEVQKQCELLEKTGNFYEAGMIYYQNNQIDRAIATLQKVEKNSKDFRNAAATLGDIFRDKNMLTQAIMKYRDAIAGEGVNKLTLHPYYNLARVLETHGNPSAALEIYERILSRDYNFSDVAKRIKKLKDELKRAEAVIPGRTAGEERFELLEEIGRGGMGVVYKAKDRILNRIVAYKLLRSPKGDKEAVESFLREARAAAALNHPNIVTIFDVGQERGGYYLVMEFVEGVTLKARIREMTRLPLRTAVQLIIQLCKALDYAHKNKIVHRDIKSNNIMLNRDNVVKILDFGLAKILQDVMSLQTGSMGTPFYASPEQIIGDPKVMPIDHRTDIYSLGVTIFEMVTGTLPFTKGDISYHHIHSQPPVPSSLVSGVVPVEIDRLVLRCLAKEPHQRYSSASEIIEELKTII